MTSSSRQSRATEATFSCCLWEQMDGSRANLCGHNVSGMLRGCGSGQRGTVLCTRRSALSIRCDSHCQAQAEMCRLQEKVDV